MIFLRLASSVLHFFGSPFASAWAAATEEAVFDKERKWKLHALPLNIDATDENYDDSDADVEVHRHHSDIAQHGIVVDGEGEGVIDANRASLTGDGDVSASILLEQHSVEEVMDYRT